MNLVIRPTSVDPNDVEFINSFNYLVEKLILSGCVDGKLNKEKIFANIDLAYNMFCQNILTRKIP